MWTDKIYLFLINPITGVIVALVLAAVAISGRFSVTASNVILVLALLVGCFGIFQSGWIVHLNIICCLILGIALTLISWWIQPSSPQQPTANEIATEVIKKMPADMIKPVGNLKQRTIELVDGITKDFFSESRRYPAPPLDSTNPKATEEAHLKWVQNTSEYFKWKYFEKALELRDEFAQLHIKEPDLDYFFKSQASYEGDNRQYKHPILNWEILKVRDCLKAMADKIPSK